MCIATFVSKGLIVLIDLLERFVTESVICESENDWSRNFYFCHNYGKCVYTFRGKVAAYLDRNLIIYIYLFFTLVTVIYTELSHSLVGSRVKIS